MSNIILGIDISKEKFDIALMVNNKIKARKFSNNEKGFNELDKWLKHKEVDTGHACMEATGSYGLKIAQYLYNNNFKVSIVNPARIKGFSLSRLSRVKTDKADCELIAYFCQAMKPDLWQPTAKHIRELQEWVRRFDSLTANRNQESNRLENLSEQVAISVKKHIDFLDKEIEEVEKLIANHIKQHEDLHDKSVLLDSIPGIGKKTISVILAFLNNIESFDSVKQVVAFVGINPKARQSGSSVRGISRISKTGNSDLRRAFYMPAVVAMKHNPIIKDFCQNLSNAGKHKMVILIAVMRKLLHIIYGILKTKTLFNANIMSV